MCAAIYFVPCSYLHLIAQSLKYTKLQLCLLFCMYVKVGPMFNTKNTK